MAGLSKNASVLLRTNARIYGSTHAQTGGQTENIMPPGQSKRIGRTETLDSGLLGRNGSGKRLRGL